MNKLIEDLTFVATAKTPLTEFYPNDIVVQFVIKPMVGPFIETIKLGLVTNLAFILIVSGVYYFPDSYETSDRYVKYFAWSIVVALVLLSLYVIYLVKNYCRCMRESPEENV
ncbi:hypothetical protein SI65_09976 [Aspergillus cristatus]|uniref:Uncharacterized protein n=1 Tax=Aspergillus cristatus TaxID=573508 RepID=A0A1E3B1B5_ASPCR|nr:hypothetical protein SI65_09976 [Aspergillus cristatus]